MKLTKKSAIALVAILIVIVAVGSYAYMTTIQPPTAAKKLRVAVMYATPLEEPWNTVMHEAMTRAKKELNIDYVYSEKVDYPDAERVLREYVAAGYDIIIPHSWGYHEVAIKVAKEFPNVAFAQGSGPTNLDYGRNVVMYDYWIQDAAYLAGITAGKMTKTNTIGVLTAYAVPDVNRLVNAFIAGARSVNPNVKARVIYIESWFDLVKGKEASRAMIEAGADFIYGERYGAFEAIKESGKPVYAFGNIVDQSSLARDIVLGSIAWDLKTFIKYIVEMKSSGQWKGGIVDWGMKEGWAKLVWNEQLKGKVPADVMNLVDKTRDDIVAGRFKVPVYDDWKPERWR